MARLVARLKHALTKSLSFHTDSEGAGQHANQGKGWNTDWAPGNLFPARCWGPGGYPVELVVYAVPY